MWRVKCLQHRTSEAGQKGRGFLPVRKPEGRLLVGTDEVRTEVLHKHHSVPFWKASFGFHPSTPEYCGLEQTFILPSNFVARVMFWEICSLQRSGVV